MTRPIERDQRFCASQIACDGSRLPARYKERTICRQCEMAQKKRGAIIPPKGLNVAYATPPGGKGK